MAIYSSNRRELRHYTATLCNDLLVGTVSSPSTAGTFVVTTVGFNSLSDDRFNDYRECFVYSGSTITVGTSLNPTNWVSTSNTMTIAPVTTLVAGDSIEMHDRWLTSDYNNAINLAIEGVAGEALVYKMDESITLSAATYQYTIPAQFTYIHRLDQRSSTSSTSAYIGEYRDELGIGREAWRLIPGSTGVIELVYDYWTPSSGYNLRIIGMASPATLSADATQCPISPKYIAYEAAAMLHESMIRGDDDDSKYHDRQATRLRTVSEGERARVVDVNLPVGSRKVIE